MDHNRVIIFDTTLRDGEQSPGASMNLEEKVRIALVLEEMGVDVIEAGFPIASNGDFEAVEAVAKAVRNSVICGLARATRGDIERCAEAIRPAARGRSGPEAGGRQRAGRAGGGRACARHARPHSGADRDRLRRPSFGRAPGR
jgi:hypothetical protein